MKLILDFLALILFFIAYWFTNIYIASGVAIATSVTLTGWIFLQGKKPDVMQWISLAVVTIFCGAAIIFQNEEFTKWKPTVLYGLMAATLAGAQVFFNKNLLKILMEKQTKQPGQAPIKLPDFAWKNLIWMWVAFFIFMGVVNRLVADNFSSDAWVSFKTFGGIGLMVVFVIVQSVYMTRHIQEDDLSEEASKINDATALNNAPPATNTQTDQ